MRGVKSFDVEEDLRHVRRALIDDELARRGASRPNPRRAGDLDGPVRSRTHESGEGGIRTPETGLPRLTV
jgi:hypothetical protein